MNYSNTLQKYELLYKDEPIISLVNTYLMLQKHTTLNEEVIMQAISRILQVAPLEELISVKEEVESESAKELLEAMIKSSEQMPIGAIANTQT